MVVRKPPLKKWWLDFQGEALRLGAPRILREIICEFWGARCLRLKPSPHLLGCPVGSSDQWLGSVGYKPQGIPHL